MTVAVLSIVGERAHTHIGPWAMVTNKCPKSGVQTPTRKKGGGGFEIPEEKRSQPR